MAKLKILVKYWVTPNSILYSKYLSWKAKWLYWYIQSKPDNWDFAISRFEWKDWIDSTRSWILELEKVWLLKRKKIRKNDWTWDIEYILYDSNHIGKSNMETTLENPTTENPTTENPKIIKTRDSKQDIIKYNNIISKDIIEQSSEIVEYWNKIINNGLLYFKQKIWISDFKENRKIQWMRMKNIMQLSNKIWKHELLKRLNSILDDDFKLKNCNSINYLYKELKAFIDLQKKDQEKIEKNCWFKIND